MRPFEYDEPTTLDEAVAILKRCDGQGGVFAGGTDLLVQMKEHQRQPARLIDIKKIVGLDELVFDEQAGLRIGALATTRAVETSPLVQRKYASLFHAVSHFASIQVRNRATVIGNVCRASPSADTLPPLIADAAQVHLHGPDGRRSVALEDFCIAPGRTVRTDDELVTHLVVPAPLPHTGKVYIKHGRRIEMELATVGVAVTITMTGGTCSDVRIALAAVASTPIRALRAESMLRHQKVGEPLLIAAAQAASEEARPIGDVRGSADYRRRLVGVLTRRALEQAIKEAT